MYAPTFCPRLRHNAVSSTLDEEVIILRTVALHTVTLLEGRQACGYITE